MQTVSNENGNQTNEKKTENNDEMRQSGGERNRRTDREMSPEHQGVNKPKLHTVMTSADPATM